MKAVLLALVLALSGCISAASQQAYVWALRGQSDPEREADKLGCYREAQGPNAPWNRQDPAANPSGVTANTLVPGLLGAGIGAAAGGGRGAAAGGLAGMGAAYVFAMFQAERWEIANYPPDLAMYEGCLTARGYDVSWPKGMKP
jgi:hypothetical protein